MPDTRRAHCQRCGGHKRNVGSISWEGLCTGCACEAVAENITGIATQSGYPYRAWLGGMQRFINRTRVDAAQAAE